MRIARVPVQFWGYTYPYGDMEIKYSPKTKFWTYTIESAYRGDTPYSQWIEKLFKPKYEKKEGMRYVSLSRQLIFDGDIPIKMEYGITEYLELPDEVKKQLQEWYDVERWKTPIPPEPDTSKYEREVNLDTENWQQDDVVIKNRGIC